MLHEPSSRYRTIRAACSCLFPDWLRSSKKHVNKKTSRAIANLAPNAALLDELGEESAVEGYSLRPPKGYSLSQPAGGPPDAKMVGWAGKLQSDGTSPLVLVMLGKPSPPDRLRLDEHLKASLEDVKRLYQHWSQSKPERGMLGGVTFLRSRWSGTNASKGWKTHGVMYAGIDGETYIQITTQDAEPHHEKSLEVGEAAILTFKKK